MPSVTSSSRWDFQVVLWGMAIALAGGIALPHLRVSWLPPQDDRSVWVSFPVMGSTPLQTERLITSPTEAVLSQLSNIEHLASYSLPGRSLIKLTYAEGVDVHSQEVKLRGELRYLQQMLPASTARPQIFYSSPQKSEHSHIRYAIQAPKGSYLYRPYVEMLMRQGMEVPAGVVQQTVSGQGTQALLVEVSPYQLARRGLSFEEVTQWLCQAFTSQPLEAHESIRKEGGVSLGGSFPSLSTLPYAALSITDRSIPLHTLAQVRQIPLAEAEQQYVNGQEVLYLEIELLPDGALAKTVKTIRNQMEQLRVKLPQGWTLRCVEDPISSLEKELHDQVIRLGIACLTVVLGLLLWTMSMQYALISGFCLVISVAIGGLGMYVGDLPVHLYSLSALSVALGMMVDQTILVGDAVRAHEPLSSLVIPLAATSLTTLASLLPLIGLGRSHWTYLADFGSVLSVMLVSSVLIATWFMPRLMRKLLPSDSPRQKRRLWRNPSKPSYPLAFAAILAKGRWLVRLCLLLLIGLPIPGLPLQYPFLQGLSHSFLEDIQRDLHFDPPEDPMLVVEVSFAHPTPEEASVRLLAPLQAKLRDLRPDAVLQTETTIQRNGEAKLNIALASAEQAPAVKLMVMRYALQHDGATWNIYGVGQGLDTREGNEHSFEMILTGYHYQTLDSLVGEVVERLIEHPKVSDIDPHALGAYWRQPKRGYAVQFDSRLTPEGRQAWGDHAKRFSQAATPSGRVTLAQSQGEWSYPIVIQAAGYEDMSLDTWLNSTAPSVAFPLLKHAVEIVPDSFAHAIVRKDRSYLRRIRYKYAGAYEFGRRWAHSQLASLSTDWPAGFSAELFQRKGIPPESQQQLWLVVLASLLLIWLICSILFNSPIDGMYMVEAIPLAIVGILLTHSLEIAPLDEGAIGATILVMGLSVNNSIILYHKLKSVPVLNWEHAWKAVQQKIRPISLATLSTIVGMSPILWYGDQGDFWYSLATFTTGGLTVSTLFLLVLWWPFWVVVLRKRAPTQ